MIKHVLFWDIDGTLLSTARGGVSAWEEAFTALTQLPFSLQEFPTAGLTDVEIANIIAKNTNQSSTTFANDLLRGYEDRLPQALTTRQGKVLPGIFAILEKLQTMPWIASYLLTGNTKRGAAAKLAYYGLQHFFVDGAFSDDLPDRPSIAKLALKTIQQRITHTEPVDYYVIGDTPHDINCGKVIGAKTIAVCTGSHTRENLLAHEPWLVLDSLAETDEFLKLFS